MEKLKHKIASLRTLALLMGLYALLPLFFLSTNPDSLPLPLLLLPFLILFTILFVTVLLVGRQTRMLRGLTRRRQFTISGLIAAIPMLLAVFQSLHQLNVRDIVIALGLVVAVSFYIARADFLR